MSPKRIVGGNVSCCRRHYRERGKPHCPPEALSARAGKSRDNLSGKGVWDCGESEWLPVMGGIGACALTRKRADFRVVQSSLYD